MLGKLIKKRSWQNSPSVTHVTDRLEEDKNHKNSKRFKFDFFLNVNSCVLSLMFPSGPRDEAAWHFRYFTDLDNFKTCFQNTRLNIFVFLQKEQWNCDVLSLKGNGANIWNKRGPPLPAAKGTVAGQKCCTSFQYQPPVETDSYRVFFSLEPPSKSSKYKKVNLG